MLGLGLSFLNQAVFSGEGWGSAVRFDDGFVGWWARGRWPWCPKPPPDPLKHSLYVPTLFAKGGVWPGLMGMLLATPAMTTPGNSLPPVPAA